jgi:hypothetical protein
VSAAPTTTLTALADQADVIEQLQADRAALALILMSVPERERNAAVMASGVNTSTYARALSHGLGAGR